MSPSLAILAAGLPRQKMRRPRVEPGHPTIAPAKVAPLTIYVSDHAYDRVKERLGLKGKAARKRVEQAWERGIMAHDLPGDSELGRWLVRKQRTNPAVTSIRVLGEWAFVFAGATCLTVLDVKVQDGRWQRERSE